jgi:hypothetical protein
MPEDVVHEPRFRLTTQKEGEGPVAATPAVDGRRSPHPSYTLHRLASPAPSAAYGNFAFWHPWSSSTKQTDYELRNELITHSPAPFSLPGPASTVDAVPPLQTFLSPRSFGHHLGTLYASSMISPAVLSDTNSRNHNLPSSGIRPVSFLVQHDRPELPAERPQAASPLSQLDPNAFTNIFHLSPIDSPGRAYQRVNEQLQDYPIGSRDDIQPSTLSESEPANPFSNPGLHYWTSTPKFPSIQTDASLNKNAFALEDIIPLDFQWKPFVRDQSSPSEPAVSTLASTLIPRASFDPVFGTHNAFNHLKHIHTTYATTPPSIHHPRPLHPPEKFVLPFSPVLGAAKSPHTPPDQILTQPLRPAAPLHRSSSELTFEHIKTEADGDLPQLVNVMQQRQDVRDEANEFMDTMMGSFAPAPGVFVSPLRMPRSRDTPELSVSASHIIH